MRVRISSRDDGSAHFWNGESLGQIAVVRSKRAGQWAVKGLESFRNSMNEFLHEIIEPV
ncbi:hypothetical protein ACHAXS_006575, partial [Conticribra weissflogii]